MRCTAGDVGSRPIEAGQAAAGVGPAGSSDQDGNLGSNSPRATAHVFLLDSASSQLKIIMAFTRFACMDACVPSHESV